MGHRRNSSPHHSHSNGWHRRLACAERRLAARKEGRVEHSVIVEHRARLSVSSGQWPDETGRWPVVAKKCEMSGFATCQGNRCVPKQSSSPRFSERGPEQVAEILGAIDVNGGTRFEPSWQQGSSAVRPRCESPARTRFVNRCRSCRPRASQALPQAHPRRMPGPRPSPGQRG